MDAVRYHGPNQPLILEKIPSPDPHNLAPNEIIVEVHAAALCHTELHFADGTLNLGAKPITLGHEAAGIIVHAGSDVPPHRVGEHVIMYYYVGCGDCRWCCQTSDEQLCNSMKAQLGFVSDGGLARFLKSPARNAIKLPENLSFIEAAPIGCGVTTAVHAARRANVRKGEFVVIYGCNGVGFGLVQLLRNKYEARIIVATRSDAKRAKALELGAEVAIDASDPTSVAMAVREATGGDGADVIFECVGRRETMDACIGWDGALGKRGRLVLLGYHAGNEHEFRCHPIPMIVYEQTILGSVGATLADLEEAVALVANGMVTAVVDSTLPLERFQEGLDRIKSCDCVGKVVCLPPSS